ncbi:MAG: toast rack family protein [Bacteroidota bacterium]
MMKMRDIFVLLLAIFFFTGCDPDKWLEGGSEKNREETTLEPEAKPEEIKDEGKYQKKFYEVRKKDITSLRADIEIPSGLFRLASTNEVLVDARFSYRKEQREPRVNFNQVEDQGQLLVRLPKLEENLKNERNVTSIKLQEDMPMNLKVTFGAGKAEFKLEKLNLQRTSFKMGAGEFEVKLPPSIQNLDFDAGVGSASIDLSGDRTIDLDAELNCGIGELVILLPSNVGIKARIAGLIGGINARGFTKRGGSYYNDEWENAKNKIKIEINGGIGDIKLKMVNED